jgi:hypothetical protein
MSYSFILKAASKAEAKVAVAQKMAEVAYGQKCHARDMVAAVTVAHAFIDQLTDDETQDVNINMLGSLMGSWTGSDVTRCTSANVAVTAFLSAKVVETPAPADPVAQTDAAGAAPTA